MTANFRFQQDKIYFLPLGGCGIFGANASLYGYKGKWILVDCGMGFPDSTLPSVDLLVPNLNFLYEQKDNLLACIITHAHEDHIGALEYLWPKLNCPIYATDFASEMLHRKFSEHSWFIKDKNIINTVKTGANFKIGEFYIDMIEMAHSIPEAQALAIRAGDNIPAVIHTGDWKLDNNPCVSHVTDEKKLKKIGNDGVLAVIGDSTNAMIEGFSGSELEVRKNLTKLFSELKEVRIFTTIFASNIARIDSIARAAIENGRYVGLSGRSLWRSVSIAQSLGYLQNLPPFLDEKEAMQLERGKAVIICTGSQGEARASLARISKDEHPRVKPNRGDVLVFSALRIPSNEPNIDRVLGRFWEMGVDVITNKTTKYFPIHVSGHPCQEELKKLYQWLKPKAAIPVHGEVMQMDHHADIAKACGIKNVINGKVGSVYEISKNGKIQIIDEVEHGLLAVEARTIKRIDDEALNVRRRITFNGAVIVSLVVDCNYNLLYSPQITALGLIDENSETGVAIIQKTITAVKNAIENMKDKTDCKVKEKARITARKFFYNYMGKKPQTRVHLFTVK